MAKPQEAAAIFEQSLHVDPTWNWLLNGFASALIKARRFSEALEPIEKSMRIRRSAGVLMYRGMLAAELDRHADAIEWFREALRGSPRSPAIRGRTGYSLAKMGQAGEGRALIKSMPAEQQVPDWEIAAIHAGLGDRDEAFRRLDQAYAKRSFTISYAKVDYRFRDLRNDSRFRDLMRRLRLE